MHQNEHQVDSSEVVWRPSVYGIVFHNGKLLVSPQHGIGYDLPGGGVDIDESFHDAVVREVKEETGIDVCVIDLVDMVDNIFIWKPESSTERQVFHSVLSYYRCEYIGGELSTDGFDETEKEYADMAEWIELDKTLTMQVASSYDFRPVIEKAMKM